MWHRLRSGCSLQLWVCWGRLLPRPRPPTPLPSSPEVWWAALSAFTSAAHPGRQADEYETARLAIRDQAWNLLNTTGGYKDLETDDERYVEFVNKIRDIVHRKRAATHIQM